MLRADGAGAKTNNLLTERAGMDGVVEEGKVASIQWRESNVGQNCYHVYSCTAVSPVYLLFVSNTAFKAEY